MHFRCAIRRCMLGVASALLALQALFLSLLRSNEKRRPNGTVRILDRILLGEEKL